MEINRQTKIKNEKTSKRQFIEQFI